MWSKTCYKIGGIDMTLEEYHKQVDYKENPIFPLVIQMEVIAKNLERIHPLKQLQANAIAMMAKYCPDIEKIVVFGSAKEWYCGFHSDIDLCIHTSNADIYDTPEFNLFRSNVSFITEGIYDLLVYQELRNEELKNNIDKGVCIYERIKGELL